MSRWIDFQFVSIEPVTEAQALAHQNGKGFNPMGYGFYRFKCEHVPSDQMDGSKDYYKATWQCQASCD